MFPPHQRHQPLHRYGELDTKTGRRRETYSPMASANASRPLKVDSCRDNASGVGVNCRRNASETASSAATGTALAPRAGDVDATLTNGASAARALATHAAPTGAFPASPSDCARAPLSSDEHSPNDRTLTTRMGEDSVEDPSPADQEGEKWRKRLRNARVNTCNTTRPERVSGARVAPGGRLATKGRIPTSTSSLGIDGPADPAHQ